MSASRPKCLPLDLLLLLLTFAMVLFTATFSVIDDAYITFRYSYNLAQRGELVFNPGERVEGATNLLWTLLLAPGAKVVPVPLDVLSVLLSLACIGFLCFRLRQLGSLLAGSHLTGTLAATLLLLSADFVLGATNGLEAGLYAALLTELVYRYAHGQFRAASGVSGLLFMTRPEGLALGLLLVLLIGWERRSWRECCTSLGIIGGIFVAITLARLAYYGSPIPNSVIAKSFPVSRLPEFWPAISRYFSQFALTNVSLVAIAAGGICSLLQARRLKTRADYVLAFAALGILFSGVVAARNAGDWMPHFRLLTQYGPLYAVALMLLVRGQTFPVALGVILFAQPLLTAAQSGFAQPLRFRLRTADLRPPVKEAAHHLAHRLEPTDTISSEVLGYFSYLLPDNYSHDPMGLTDAHIARHGEPFVPYGKRDAAYTLGTARPSVVLWAGDQHFRHIDPALLAPYAAFWSGKRGWEFTLAMVRKDRLADLGPAFAGWQRVELGREGMRVPPAPPRLIRATRTTVTAHSPRPRLSSSSRR